MREWVSEHLGESVTDPRDGAECVIEDGVWMHGRFWWVVRGPDGGPRRVRIEDTGEAREAA